MTTGEMLFRLSVLSDALSLKESIIKLFYMFLNQTCAMRLDESSFICTKRHELARPNTSASSKINPARSSDKSGL